MWFNLVWRNLETKLFCLVWFDFNFEIQIWNRIELNHLYTHNQIIFLIWRAKPNLKLNRPKPVLIKIYIYINKTKFKTELRFGLVQFEPINQISHIKIFYLVQFDHQTEPFPSLIEGIKYWIFNLFNRSCNYCWVKLTLTLMSTIEVSIN